MPIIENYNPFNDPTLRNPLVRRGSDIIKRFVSPSTVTAGGGNGVTNLDDPTYLGFSLRFDISTPLFNGAFTSFPQKPPSETPFFDTITNETAGLGLNPANLDLPSRAGEVGDFIKSGESAVGYLKRVGENNRASYLTSFIQGLREVNEYRPYYWQTIDGITEAWSKSLNFSDPFIGSGEGEGITIGCLEAIDLKISALFNLYKAAVYDSSYKRMVLPRNLMYFNVYVDVYEIRRFKFTQTWLNRLNDNASQNDVDRFLNDNTSKITFLFSDCIWDPIACGKVFETVSNAGGNEMAVTNIKWQYNSISIGSDFSGYDQELNDRQINQSKGNLGSAVKNATKNQAIKAANAALNRAEGLSRAVIGSQVLGNAFGLQNQAINFIQNPGALSQAISGALLQSNRSINNLRLGDNPLGEGIQPNNSLPSGNIFVGQVPNPLGGLAGSNAFGARPSGPPPLQPNNAFE